jgi:hypothetical protein
MGSHKVLQSKYTNRRLCQMLALSANAADSSVKMPTTKDKRE